MSGFVLSVLVGCVLRYGGETEVPVDGANNTPTTQAPVPDFAALEKEILAIADANDDLDAGTAARIAAAQELTVDLRNPRKDPRQASADYLERLIAIERRALDMPELPPDTFNVTLPAVNEAPLGVDTPGPLPDPKEAVVAARSALAAGQYDQAIAALKPLRGSEGWSEIAPVWQEAVDGWVHQERERAGQLFIDARSLPDDKRIPATKEVLAVLEGLLRDYPETTYREALERNIELVRKELPAGTSP